MVVHDRGWVVLVVLAPESSWGGEDGRRGDREDILLSCVLVDFYHFGGKVGEWRQIRGFQAGRTGETDACVQLAARDRRVPVHQGFGFTLSRRLWEGCCWSAGDYWEQFSLSRHPKLS